MDIDRASSSRETASLFSQAQGDSVDLEGLLSGLRNKSGRAAFTDYTLQSKEQDIQKLRRIWVAERAAPEILPFEGPLLDRMMERVRSQVSAVFSGSDEFTA